MHATVATLHTPSGPHSSFATQEDDAFIAELLTGSELAWRRFHLRYDRLIYRCITKVTARFASRVSQDDIREIYATLLVQLLSHEMHKLRTFDSSKGSRLSSWIGLLSVNAAYDYLRSVRREPNRAPLAEAEVLRSEGPSPFDVAEQRERAEILRELLKDLSAKDQQFVDLYFGEGLEPEEVAHRMQISIKTVYSKKHKIQARLETLMSRAA